MNAAELILNDDGSVYHLHLHPEDIADTIITVGDPDRVTEVSQYFDKITLRRQKREFVTHTGEIQGKRITVISTGIGTDNIDIVFNELDALANIDFKTRQVKSHLRRLNIIRVGTSGSIQPDIPVDSFVASAYALGFDNLLHFYAHDNKNIVNLEQAFADYLQQKQLTVPSLPYAYAADANLLGHFSDLKPGITATFSGFYAPQGRQLRLTPKHHAWTDQLADFSYQNHSLTNFEMETAGIYGMATLLGHRALSLNAILANRARGEFSQRGSEVVKSLIELTLERVITL